jgi:hypothetical protein
MLSTTWRRTPPSLSGCALTVTALRQQAAEREWWVGQLKAELAAAERMVGTLRRERTDRTEWCGVARGIH